MKARAVLASSLASILGLVFLFTACAPGGGSGASMMATVPDGDYQMVFHFKPNEFLKSGFITKMKANFEQSAMFLADLEKGPEETGMKIEEIDSMMAFATTSGDAITMISGNFDQAKVRAEFEKNKGATLTEKTEAGKTYWIDSDYDAGMIFNGNVGIQANEEALKSIIATMGGTGKKYTDSEAYKKVGRLMDTGATISFASANAESFDPSMMAMQIGMFEEDQEKVQMLSESFSKVTAMAGNFTMRDAIDGRFSVVFSEAAAAKSVADYMNGKKDFFFEKIADQAQELAAMMPDYNIDRDKIKGLSRLFSFAAEGDLMHVNIKVAWDDIAFLFAKK